MFPIQPPILWCDACGIKRVTWADRICPTCRADLHLQLERFLADVDPEAT